ncbi:hypothetical protein GLAREA_04160 [Glarea lozoyensis ATCC 20868]|uniref:Uncharacterized protein n=1 Tax=Glarea lozoyensis (strain ATCC 20868 / MF5171) TaxID=1116229 RepID=S3DXW5_GLAL2|nr:uncharacterized protein GLAREA_04160 [Glarea lozoyensis ATCC 20868]EPE31193.1 hypothetical protein GLAREA_04160 [Glarea lozoyensis ATCC 20868]
MDFDPNVLESKLKKVLEEAPPYDGTQPSRSPSLASTDVTGALNDWANREPLTEEEKARRKRASDRAYELTFGKKPRGREDENDATDNKSPSLASTSSGALKYHQSVYREPLTAEEEALEDEKDERFQVWAWGDKATQHKQKPTAGTTKSLVDDTELAGRGQQNGWHMASKRSRNDPSAADMNICIGRPSSQPWECLYSMICGYV